jgi:hypothetical protein
MQRLLGKVTQSIGSGQEKSKTGEEIERVSRRMIETIGRVCEARRRENQSNKGFGDGSDSDNEETTTGSEQQQ